MAKRNGSDKANLMVVSYTGEHSGKAGFKIVNLSNNKVVYDSGFTYFDRAAARKAGDAHLANM